MGLEYRLDLHTHSIISYDGGISLKQYRQLLEQNNFIAVTDHNEISFALNLQKEFGDKVIVGEEIRTIDGEIIGLFLQSKINPGLSVEETIRQIKAQGGLVYIPHPFETQRQGLPLVKLGMMADLIDIVEVFNARLRSSGLSKKATDFARDNNLAQAASSDAHGMKGFGSAYTSVLELPTKDNLVNLLRSATLAKKRAPLLSYLDPALNKLRKKINL